MHVTEKQGTKKQFLCTTGNSKFEPVEIVYPSLTAPE